MDRRTPRRLVAAAALVVAVLAAGELRRRSSLAAWRAAWLTSSPAAFARSRRSALEAAERLELEVSVS